MDFFDRPPPAPLPAARIRALYAHNLTAEASVAVPRKYRCAPLGSTMGSPFKSKSAASRANCTTYCLKTCACAFDADKDI